MTVPVGKCTSEKLQLTSWNLSSRCDRSVGHSWKPFYGNGACESWSTSGSRYAMMNGVLLYMCSFFACFPTDTNTFCPQKRFLTSNRKTCLAGVSL